MFDADYYNTLAIENRAEVREINKKKNSILSMTNQQKKQSAWNTLFPKMPESEMVY